MLGLLMPLSYNATGALKQAIERDFGSLDKLKEQFNKTTAAVQGSGWGWLGYSPSTQKLESERLLQRNTRLGIALLTRGPSWPCIASQL